MFDFLHIHSKVKIPAGDLGLDDSRQSIEQFLQVKTFAVQCQPSAFNSGHVKDIIDQGKQMRRGGGNLLKAVPYFFLFINMGKSDPRHADDGIHRRPDIVRHVGQEYGLRLIGPFGFVQCCLQFLFAYLLFGKYLFVFFINNALPSRKVNRTETQQQNNRHQHSGNDKIPERAGGGLQHIGRHCDQQVPGAVAYGHIHQIIAFAHPGKNQGTGCAGSHVISKLSIRLRSLQVGLRQTVQIIVCYHHGVFIVRFQKDISLFVYDRGIALFRIYIQSQKIFQLVKSRCHEDARYF